MNNKFKITEDIIDECLQESMEKSENTKPAIKKSNSKKASPAA